MDCNRFPNFLDRVVVPGHCGTLANSERPTSRASWIIKPLALSGHLTARINLSTEMEACEAWAELAGTKDDESMRAHR